MEISSGNTEDTASSKYRKCVKCNSSECKYRNICTEMSTMDIVGNVNDDIPINIFDEVANDNTRQTTLYKEDSSELLDYEVEIDKINCLKIYDKAVNDLENTKLIASIQEDDEVVIAKSTNDANTISDSKNFTESDIHVRRRLIIQKMFADNSNNDSDEVLKSDEANDFEKITTYDESELIEKPTDEQYDKDKIDDSHSETIDDQSDTDQSHDQTDTSRNDWNTDGQSDDNVDDLNENINNKHTADEQSTNEKILVDQTADIDQPIFKEVTSEHYDLVQNSLEERLLNDTSETINEQGNLHTNETLSEDSRMTNNSQSNDDIVTFTTHVFAFGNATPIAQHNVEVATKYQNLKTKLAKPDSDLNTASILYAQDPEPTILDESDDDAMDPDYLLASSVQDVQSISGFLNGYNEFLERMSSRLDHSRKLIEDLKMTKAKRDEELNLLMAQPQEREAKWKEPENVFASNYMNETRTEIPTDNKGELIERLLASKSPLFDLCAEEVNEQILALQDNKQNTLNEIVDKVYDQRDLYARDEWISDEPLDSVKYEEFSTCIEDETCDNLASIELAEKRFKSEVLQSLCEYDAQLKEERRKGITFFCENVDKLLVQNASFTPEPNLGIDEETEDFDEYFDATSIPEDFVDINDLDELSFER